jgi:hypothetical protein
VGERVDRTRALRALAGVDAQREGGFLVRQGDVGAASAGLGEGAQRGGEGCRFGVDGAIVQRDPELAAELGVDARRQRVRDRVAEHGELRGAHLRTPSASAPRRARNR